MQVNQIHLLGKPPRTGVYRNLAGKLGAGREALGGGGTIASGLNTKGPGVSLGIDVLGAGVRNTPDVPRTGVFRVLRGGGIAPSSSEKL